MEAANHNMFERIIFFITLFSCLVVGYGARSQQSHQELSDLLDSAVILKLKKEYATSMEICNSVIELAKRSGDYENEARAYSEMGDVYRDQHKLKQADSMLDISRQIVSSQLDQHNQEHVRNIFYRGKTLRTKYFDGLIDKKDSALNYYESALELNLKNQYTDHVFTIDLLLEMANFYRWTGEDEKARYFYNKLIEEAESHLSKTDYRRGLYLHYLGAFYYGIGDYERAQILTELAKYIFQQSDARDFNMEIACHYQLGAIYFETMDYLKSIDQFQSSIEKLESRYGTSHSSLIQYYTSICQILISIDSIQEAIEYALKAMDLIKKYPVYAYNYHFLYNNLAEAFAKNQDYEKAEMFFKKSIDYRIHEFGAHHEEVYYGYRFFGEYFEQRGLFRNSLENYQSALSALFPDFHPTNVFDNPDFKDYNNREPLLFILFDKSGALYSYYSESDNVEALRSAFELYVITYEKIDELIDGDYLDKSSMHLFNRFNKGLDQSIECAAQLYKLTGDDKYLQTAFQFIEKNKYILLYKALLKSLANVEESQEVLTDAEHFLSSQIDNLRLKISKLEDVDSLFENRNRLIQFLFERDNLSPLTTSAEDTSTSIEFDKETIKIQTAQQLLENSHEVIIEYHKTSNKIYSFILGNDFVDFVNIEWTPELKQNIKTFKNQVSGNSLDASDIEAYQSSAHFLYEQLLMPIEKQLSGRDSINRIIIVPDGPLATLPFDALITDFQKEATGYWSLSYLCKKYTLSYAYSLSILEKNLSRELSKKRPTVLALAYSDISNNKRDKNGELTNDELPYSAMEIDNINKRLNTTYFLGEDATESRFKTEVRDYSIIHLAIHGEGDTANMLNSRLIFNPYKEVQEDGVLHAHELYNLNLDKLDLAVLSACETGIGKQYEGEGIFSIARGFAYAGCPSIVMSLWKVNDKATAELMDQFYKFLADGMQKDEALKMAKLHYIANADDLGAHPVNWAAFILLGDYQSLQVTTSHNQWTYLLLLIAVPIFFLGHRYVMMRRQREYGS